MVTFVVTKSDKEVEEREREGERTGSVVKSH